MNATIFSKKRVWLFAVIAGLLAGGCVFNASRITTQVSGQTSSAGLTGVSMDLRSHSGNITVSGTTDPNVRATVTVSEIALQGSSPTAADQLSVSLTPVAGVATVGFSTADTSDLWEQLRFEDANLTADQSLDVWAKTTSGNISLSGVNGFVDLETTSGNITAAVVRGCYISLTSGNVDATLLPDKTFTGVTVHSTSGNVRIKVPRGVQGHVGSNRHEREHQRAGRQQIGP